MSNHLSLPSSLPPRSLFAIENSLVDSALGNLELPISDHIGPFSARLHHSTETSTEQSLFDGWNNHLIKSILSMNHRRKNTSAPEEEIENTYKEFRPIYSDPAYIMPII